MIGKQAARLVRRLLPRRRIYLDWAGLAPMRTEVRQVVRRAERLVGNPGAIHREGAQAAALLADARGTVARTLGCKSSEIIFTAGGTEGNNLALLGALEALVHRGASYSDLHVVSTTIEHASVLEPLKELERRGVAVTLVSPEADGHIAVQRITDALRPETVLVSIGWANSEIGTVQSLHAFAKCVRAHRPRVPGIDGDIHTLLHTDAGQAPLYLPAQVQGLGVHMMTIDAGKIGGPRGAGALFIAAGTSLQPQMFGGGQERGLRPGSEPVGAAAGLAEALRLAQHERASEAARMTTLRASFVDLIQKEAALESAVINGNGGRQLPSIVNLSVPDIDSEYVVLSLDHMGIACSTKSACREGEESESHVVRALGGSPAQGAWAGEPWRSQNTLRFSFGRDTDISDIRVAVRNLARTVEQYRGQ